MTTHLNLKTTRDYLRALEALDLSPYSIKTCDALGLQMRQLANLAAGDAKPTPMLQRLLEALIALKSR